MADDLIVEILDQDWERVAATIRASRVSITEELGQVGDVSVEIPLTDPAVAYLPDPDAANPYEGRVRVYEDSALQFAGVIDAHTKSIDDSSGSVSFGGKGRGIILGFYNTGRFDYLGWFLPDLFKELLRHNIAKTATLKSVSTEDDLYGAYQMVTGDPFKQNYWKSTTTTPNHHATFDLGEIKSIDAIRVMPMWWKDIDTNKFHYHNFTVETSTDNSAWTTRGTKNDSNPSSGKGHIYTFSPISARYVRLTVTGSTDGYAKIAQLLVYQNIATIGSETSYNVPFIENDDSGNMSLTSATTRPIVPGAFQGDGVITHSYVTQLGSGGAITHTFRGTQNAVFFTSGADGGASTANIYVDGVLRDTISIPANRYWYKGYDTADDLGELTDAQHTLKVEQVTGTPRVDYFNGVYRTSWRPVETDDPSIAYLGNWSEVEAAYFYNFFAAQSTTVGNEMHYSFTGDRVLLKGSKGPGFGTLTWYIDGVSQGTVNCANTGSYNKQNLADWSGSYGEHKLTVIHTGAGKLLLDRIEGDFAHAMYIRARYEPHLKVLQRMSEIVDSWLRFNHDGSVDLLGSVGAYGGSVIREGENDGGAIVSAEIENDYSETGSAVLAIVNVNGEMPIKAFVIDKEAVAEIGFKVIKLEQSDAADQFLLNRQALQYLREKRKPLRSYAVNFDPDDIQGTADVGDTTLLYAPTVGLTGTTRHRIGRMTTEYVN